MFIRIHMQVVWMKVMSPTTHIPPFGHEWKSHLFMYVLGG